MCTLIGQPRPRAFVDSRNTQKFGTNLAHAHTVCFEALHMADEDMEMVSIIYVWHLACQPPFISHTH